MHLDPDLIEKFSPPSASLEEAKGVVRHLLACSECWEVLGNLLRAREPHPPSRGERQAVIAQTTTNGRERRAYGTSTSRAGRKAGPFFDPPLCPAWP